MGGLLCVEGLRKANEIFDETLDESLDESILSYFVAAVLVCFAVGCLVAYRGLSEKMRQHGCCQCCVCLGGRASEEDGCCTRCCAGIFRLVNLAYSGVMHVVTSASVVLALVIFGLAVVLGTLLFTTVTMCDVSTDALGSVSSRGLLVPRLASAEGSGELCEVGRAAPCELRRGIGATRRVRSPTTVGQGYTNSDGYTNSAPQTS